MISTGIYQPIIISGQKNICILKIIDLNIQFPFYSRTFTDRKELIELLTGYMKYIGFDLVEIRQTFPQRNSLTIEFEIEYYRTGIIE